MTIIESSHYASGLQTFSLLLFHFYRNPYTAILRFIIELQVKSEQMHTLNIKNIECKNFKQNISRRFFAVFWMFFKKVKEKLLPEDVTTDICIPWFEFMFKKLVWETITFILRIAIDHLH